MRIRTILLSAFGAILVAALAAQAQVPSINSTLNSVFTLTYDNSTMKPTYSATGTGPIATNSTDICSLGGSATKTIKVRRILLAASATAVVTDPVAIIKRGTALNNAGSQIMAQVPYDSSNAAGTATLAEFYSTAPTTLGTVVGVIADPMVTFSNYTTGISNGPVQLYYGEFGSPIVLRGVLQSVNVNHNASAPAGAFITCTFEWTEE